MRVLVLMLFVGFALTGHPQNLAAQEFKRDRNETISSLGKKGYRVMAYASDSGYVVMQNGSGSVALCRITRPSNDRNAANSNCLISQ